MPTIQQLPQASQVNPTDEVPLSQGGIMRAASVAQILAGAQPALDLPPASLLGRAGASTGAPQTITVGAGGVWALLGDERMANTPAGGSVWTFAIK